MVDFREKTSYYLDMENSLGKNQSYCREINYELVIDLLRKEPRSATQMASILKLSNATMSSIIKNLLNIGIICVDSSSSIKGCGRKQVFYTLDDNFGLILVVNIAHTKADVSLTDVKQEVVAFETMDINKLDEDAVQKVILKANEILFNLKRKTPLKNIIISISGFVKEGEEKHFAQRAFEKQFHDIPIYLTNDGNLYANGELARGSFEKNGNGIFILLDYGIGGSFIFNNEIFKGDNGFSGEMGCLPCEGKDRFDYLEDVVSLREIMHKAESMLNIKDVDMEKLFELYQNNKDIHEMVLESANRLGKTLKSLINVLDIGTVVINGRVTNFGEEYLNMIKKETDRCFKKCDVSFSKLLEKGQLIGGAAVGTDYILKKTLEK